MSTKRDLSEMNSARNSMLIGVLVFYLVIFGSAFLSLKEPLESLLVDTAILVALVAMVITFLRVLTQQFPQRWTDRRWRARAVVVVATALAMYLAVITDAIDKLPQAWIATALWPIWIGLSWLLVAHSRDRWVAIVAFVLAFLFSQPIRR